MLTILVQAPNQFIPLFLIGYLHAGLADRLVRWRRGWSGSLMIFSNLYHFNLLPAISRAKGRRPRGLTGPRCACHCALAAWGACSCRLRSYSLARPVLSPCVPGQRFSEAAPILEVLVWTPTRGPVLRPRPRRASPR